MDFLSYNRNAWDRQVEDGNRWTQPVGREEIARARGGDLNIVLTPTRSIPSDWLGALSGKRVLCLAGGGGQQAPLLAAAGAQVTTLDNSPNQLARDQEVAAREGLQIRTIQGDMRDLTPLADGEFELIVHPCSNSFVDDVRPVWKECWRVLQTGGSLLSGFINPIYFIFDYDQLKAGKLVAKHSIPYSDAEDLDAAQLEAFIADNEPLMFGHTLEHLIGGQIDAGFSIDGFFEDHFHSQPESLLDQHLPCLIATKATK